METIRVIIADDHQIIIDGLKALFDDHERIEVVGTANNGRELIDVLKLINADIILMDIDMPRLNGIEATKLIKKDRSDLRVIILSMHATESIIKTLIQAGAEGFLPKNSDESELIEAINRVHQGQKYFSSEITASLAGGQSGADFGSSSLDYADLTEREIEIIKLIAEGLTNKEIGEKLFISHRTVDTHRTNLMKKAGVNNVAGLIRFALKNGIIN